MVIGILTHHWVFNYGANLQTLSTVSFLKKNGHTPYVINWVQTDAEEYYYSSTKAEMAKMFHAFQREYYPLTELCRNAEDIANVIKKYGIEKVVIGSDTVWMLHSRQFSIRHLKWTQPTSESIFPNPFWGEFLDYGVDVPVIAYSAATLDMNLSDFKSQKNMIGNYLRRFNRISTRDQYTADVVSFFTNGDIVPEITPDPVFSFNNNYHQNITREKFLSKYNLPSKYILICFTEAYKRKAESCVRKMQQIAYNKGYTLIELPRQTGNRLFNITQIEEILDPVDWYNLIRFSYGFIGQLMHPIVIAIHNAVPFFCLDYYGRRKLRGTYVDYRTSKAYQVVKQVDKIKQYRNIAGRFGRLPHAEFIMDSIFSSIDNPDHTISDRMNEKSNKALYSIIQ